MEFLWDKDLKMNTVHVRDVCAALWHLGQNGKVGEIYNLADSGDTGSNPFHDSVLMYFHRSRNHRQVLRVHLWN
jgi:dTDP-D-glucose 4,6-dehydratase